ncbi:putative O-methyltransferase YrrM [Microbacteriaceae bacterium MWH-Ta3]|nr:putative O-methyltransferase YrrM [Microbacteriaceae bacterium MWH-Ta3]
MIDAELVSKWAEDYAPEPEHIRAARSVALDHGVISVSPATGSYLASVVAMTRAQAIVEIGTGLGVSGMWLLHGTADASITTIDTDVDHQQTARDLMLEAGIASSRVRTISGDAFDVLPRMNDGSYDLVVVDADPAHVVELTKHALRLVRQGGVVVVPHASHGGSVANPAKRDAVTSALRTVLGDYAVDDSVTASVMPVGDGVLTLVKN